LLATLFCLLLLILSALIITIGASVASVISLYYASIVYESPPLLLNRHTTDININIHEDRYTIVIMSYSARLATLKRIISHYGVCPSINEIVIVWNKGPPPIIGTDIPTPPVNKVRVRIESQNSINNRFKPDPFITTDAVLEVDDDVLMLCSDLENGFRAWKHKGGDVMVGFFPRLITTHPTAHYLGEKTVFGTGHYNAMITAGEFLHKKYFDIYWSERLLPARKLVDELFNGEDILMSFIVANEQYNRNINSGSDGGDGGSGGSGMNANSVKPIAHFVRPRRRLDISWLTSVGISRGNEHMLKRQRCVAEFSKMFPNAKFVNATVESKPLCGLFGAGCIYL